MRKNNNRHYHKMNVIYCKRKIIVGWVKGGVKG